MEMFKKALSLDRSICLPGYKLQKQHIDFRLYPDTEKNSEQDIWLLWCWKTILWMVWRRAREEARPTIMSPLLSENWLEGFPGAPGVKESALQCWWHKFDPCSGKIPHASGQLSLWVTITEAWTPRARVLQQEKPLQWEAWTPKLESSPCLWQLEKAYTQQWRSRASKNLLIIFKKENWLEAKSEHWV